MVKLESNKMFVGLYEYMKWFYTGAQNGEINAKTWLNALACFSFKIYTNMCIVLVMESVH